MPPKLPPSPPATTPMPQPYGWGYGTPALTKPQTPTEKPQAAKANAAISQEPSDDTFAIARQERAKTVKRVLMPEVLPETPLERDLLIALRTGLGITLDSDIRKTAAKIAAEQISALINPPHQDLVLKSPDDIKANVADILFSAANVSGADQDMRRRTFILMATAVERITNLAVTKIF